MIIRNNDTISPYQIVMILIMTIIGVGIFSLPADLAKTAGSDCWLIIPVGGLISMIFTNIILLLNNRFPGKTFPEFAEVIIGKIPGKILTAIFAIYCLIFVAFEARVVNEVIKAFLLLRTPSEVIILSIILVSTYAVRGGVECVARLMEIFFPLLFIPLLLILIPGAAAVEISNIMPIFYHIKSRILVSIPMMSLSFAGYELLLYYVGFMENPKKAYLGVNLGLIFITIIYMIITILCLTMFGVNMLKESTWPLLNYVRNINLPGLFLERLDAIMLAIWLFTVYTTIVSLYFVLTYSISKILNTKEQKQFALPLVPLIYFLALIPDNAAQIDKISEVFFTYFGILIIAVVPIILLIIAWIRKLRGESV